MAPSFNRPRSPAIDKPPGSSSTLSSPFIRTRSKPEHRSYCDFLLPYPSSYKAEAPKKQSYISIQSPSPPPPFPRLPLTSDNITQLCRNRSLTTTVIGFREILNHVTCTNKEK